MKSDHLNEALEARENARLAVRSLARKGYGEAALIAQEALNRWDGAYVYHVRYQRTARERASRMKSDHLNEAFEAVDNPSTHATCGGCGLAQIITLDQLERAFADEGDPERYAQAWMTLIERGYCTITCEGCLGLNNENSTGRLGLDGGGELTVMETNNELRGCAS